VRIAVIGGGPAGLYFAILMKKADPRHQITVAERNAPDATFGWGVVFSEETLGSLRDADPQSYHQITETFARWGSIDIQYGGETIRSRGHVFSGISRRRLLQLLHDRCREVGVRLEFGREVSDASAFDDAELVVAADGVNSTVRRLYEDRFDPRLDQHGTRFAWFGTHRVFDAFTFAFRRNEHGLFQVHAYPFDAHTSTFIVECPEAVWRRAGLDRASEEASMLYCERLFAEELRGHRLMSNRSAWIGFITLSCRTWHHRNVVLVGDAAHTAHFTIGSGTKLAMEDSVSLAAALQRRESLQAALVDYEMERQPVVERFQEAARDSAAYFENVHRYARFQPVQFAFNLLTRSGRITHLELERRDAAFVATVDRWFYARDAGATATAAGRLVPPPPVLAPLRLRGISLPNRVVLAAVGEDDAEDGCLSAGGGRRLEDAAGRGPGMVLGEPAAVSAHGRITSGTPGLYREDHIEGWRRAVDRIHRSGAVAGLRLVHSGPRGSTRPRREGVDRPLRGDGWQTLAASPVGYGAWMPVPAEIDPVRFAQVREDFESATRLALGAGFDLLELDAAGGYLLASFLSPVANLRSDNYGGSLEDRARYPLEVLDAVRAAWPDERPVAIRIAATDWAPEGMEVGEAVRLAGMLAEHGGDLVHVTAGPAVNGRPVYGRAYLNGFADRIRNEAGVAVMVGGNLTTPDEANTILAGGRADLCILHPRYLDAQP
jgi:anthraniloyl-CoA monooxygenase